jgi:hypothetical protein
MRNFCHGIRVPDIRLKGLRKTRKNLGFLVTGEDESGYAIN